MDSGGEEEAEWITAAEGRRLLDEFLMEVSKDPFAVQALSDALAEGMFPVDDHGHVTFGIEGLDWMEKREQELRNQSEN